MLSDNKLSTIPKEMRNLNKMLILKLDNNPLGSIDETITSLYELEILTMAQCGISTIPASIANLKKLRHIDLHGNQIKTMNPLYSMSSLETVNMDANQLSYIDNGIGEMKSLKMLNIRNNKQIKEIREQLNELDNLTELARSGTSAEMVPAKLEATQEGIAY